MLGYTDKVCSYVILYSYEISVSYMLEFVLI